jgi:hypothetical protein
MPQAIPAIAAYAASAAAAAVTTSAVVIAVAGTAAALVASYALQKLNKPDAPGSAVNLDSGGGGRTFTIRQPTAPWEIVVGRVKKGGILAFIHFGTDDGGRENGFVWSQIVVAAHPCEHIGDVYINDELSSAEKFTGFVRINKNLGAVDQEEDADFLSEIGSEFEGHRGQGITNLAVRLKGNAAAFPQGYPNISCILWGVDEIYDPRTGQTGWTNNAVLIYAWWKTWELGQKVAWADIDLDTLIDSANVADQRVLTTGSIGCTANATTNALTLNIGARALDVGDGVRLSGGVPAGLNANTTYYAIPAADGTYQLASTVANAFTRTALDLADAGTAVTLHYYDRAQWKANGTFTLDQDKATIANQLKSAFMGFDVDVGGVWFIHAAGPTLPTRTIDESVLAGAMTTRPKRSVVDKFNSMKARYIDPAMNWQPTDAPPWTNAVYVAEDGGKVRWEEVEFPFTTDRAQVQQSMKLHMERTRRQRTIEFSADFSAVPLRPMQGVYVDNERYGWSQKQHLVVGWTLSFPSFNVRLALQEDDASVYAWSVADEIAMNAAQNVFLPDASNIPPPATITVLTPSITFEHLSVEWAAAPSAMALEYELEYRTRDVVDWTSAGKFGADDAARKHTVDKTLATDFRVRTLSSTPGVKSTWRESMAPDDPTAVASPSDGELQWTNADADFISIWRDGVFEMQIAVTTAPGLDQTQSGLPAGSYQIRSKNADGNVGNASAAVVILVGGADDDGGDGGDDGDDDGE